MGFVWIVTTLKEENELTSINHRYRLQNPIFTQKNFGVQSIKLNFILGLMKILTELNENLA